MKGKVIRVLKRIRPFAPAIVVLIIMVVILTGYQLPDLPNLVAENISMPKQEVALESKVTKTGSFTQEDGLYMGSGKGYGGMITVAVELSGGSISNIWIVDSEGEDEAFLMRAKKVIDEMIKGQSIEVDAISGATFSSKGIIEAVKNALSGIKATAAPAATADALQQKEYENLKDGTFIGTAQGFGGTVKVEVVIKDQSIQSIVIKEAKGEGATYLKRASSLTKTMVAKQSTNVDAVSGATFTSNGIIKAVRNALEQASGGGESGQNEEEGATGTFPYLDGVYYGTGTGYAGEITVAIVIEDKTLKAAIVTKSFDDSTFLTKAKTILSKAVKTQSTNIDAVSGATYSSNGIIEALKNAIKAAKNAANGKDDGEEKAPETTNTPSPETEPVTEGTYQDGTYQVTVPCSPDERKAFKAYDLSMKVEVKNDKITNLLEVKGTGDFYSSTNDLFITRAVEGTSNRIGVKKQIISTGTIQNIDAVSGATCTSNAIVEGCKEALKLAKNNGNPISPTSTPAPTKSPQPTKTPAPSITSSPIPEGSEPPVLYKDGTYSGSTLCLPDWNGEFYAYTLSLKVTITNNRISAITGISGSGNKYDSSNALFIDMAANGLSADSGVVKQILAQGMLTGIDAVSGATCSSNAIIAACEEALKSAKE